MADGFADLRRAPRLAALLASLLLGAGAAGPAVAQQAGVPVPAERPASQQEAPASTQPRLSRAAEQEPRHPLVGDWSLLWLAHGRSHALVIDRVVPGRGITDLVGRAEGDRTGVCALDGYLVDEFVGELRDGFDIRTVPLSALVRLRVRCAAEEILIEAFGLPAGSIAMAGRATILAGDGSRIVEAIAIGRPAAADAAEEQPEE